MKKNARTLKLVYSALCIALAMVLPFLTGQIPSIGKALSPIHIPVYLCGFLCGWQYGLVVGFISPLLRSLLFSMPAMVPGAVAMAFECAVYGSVCAILYRTFPQKLPHLYLSLVIAMVCGRIVWGIARYVLAGISGTSFPMSAFVAGALTDAIPGIILHLVLIPAIVYALQRAKLMPDG